MKRYFLHLSYVGTRYRGWQRQSGVNSVQEVLERTLSKILKDVLAEQLPIPAPPQGLYLSRMRYSFLEVGVVFYEKNCFSLKNESFFTHYIMVFNEAFKFTPPR